MISCHIFNFCVQKILLTSDGILVRYGFNLSNLIPIEFTQNCEWISVFECCLILLEFWVKIKFSTLGMVTLRFENSAFYRFDHLRAFNHLFSQGHQSKTLLRKYFFKHNSLGMGLEHGNTETCNPPFLWISFQVQIKRLSNSYFSSIICTFIYKIRFST